MQLFLAINRMEETDIQLKVSYVIGCRLGVVQSEMDLNDRSTQFFF